MIFGRASRPFVPSIERHQRIVEIDAHVAEIFSAIQEITRDCSSDQPDRIHQNVFFLREPHRCNSRYKRDGFKCNGPNRRIAIGFEEKIYHQLKKLGLFSNAVPMTTRSAPASYATSMPLRSLIPPPTIRGTLMFRDTFLMISDGTGFDAPLPASR